MSALCSSGVLGLAHLSLGKPRRLQCPHCAAHQCPDFPAPCLLAFPGSADRVVPEQSPAVTTLSGDASLWVRTPPGAVQKMDSNLIRGTAVPSQWAQQEGGEEGPSDPGEEVWGILLLAFTGNPGDGEQ